MKTPIALALALLCAVLASAEDVTLKDGRVLKNAKWGEGSDADSIVIQYAGGVARFRFAEFTDDWAKIIQKKCQEKYGVPAPAPDEATAQVTRSETAGESSVFLSFGGIYKSSFHAFIGTKEGKIPSSMTFHPGFAATLLAVCDKFEEWRKVCEEKQPVSFEKDIFRVDSFSASFSWDKRSSSSSARVFIAITVSPVGMFSMDQSQVVALRTLLTQAESIIEQSREESRAAVAFSGQLR